MSNLKHLKYFKNYIVEQMEGQFDEEGNPIAPAPVDNIHSFLFLGENEDGDYKYPDGSSAKSIQTFEIAESDLKKWLDSNVVANKSEDSLSENAIKVKKNNLLDYISGSKTGLSPDDMDYINKFKNNVVANIIGKRSHSIDVIFPKGGGVPSTDSFTTTFIILPSKK